MIVITSNTNSLLVELNGASPDRKKALIRISDIRSVAVDTDNATVELIFSSGEIYAFPFVAITSIDGDTNITTQEILFNKMTAIIFPT